MSSTKNQSNNLLHLVLNASSAVILENNCSTSTDSSNPVIPRTFSARVEDTGQCLVDGYSFQ